MSTFQLDTSGVVFTGNVCDHPTGGIGFEWPDLTPFAQGYVEALFASVWKPLQQHGPLWLREPTRWRHAGFSDLSPSALGMILKDCEAARTMIVQRWPKQEITAATGAHFWKLRQEGAHSHFPPLTVSLGDDGKVYLTES